MIADPIQKLYDRGRRYLASLRNVAPCDVDDILQDAILTMVGDGTARDDPQILVHRIKCSIADFYRRRKNGVHISIETDGSIRCDPPDGQRATFTPPELQFSIEDEVVRMDETRHTRARLAEVLEQFGIVEKDIDGLDGTTITEWLERIAIDPATFYRRIKKMRQNPSSERPYIIRTIFYERWRKGGGPMKINVGKGRAAPTRKSVVADLIEGVIRRHVRGGYTSAVHIFNDLLTVYDIEPGEAAALFGGKAGDYAKALQRDDLFDIRRDNLFSVIEGLIRYIDGDAPVDEAVADVQLWHDGFFWNVIQTFVVGMEHGKGDAYRERAREFVIRVLQESLRETAGDVKMAPAKEV